MRHCILKKAFQEIWKKQNYNKINGKYYESNCFFELTQILTEATTERLLVKCMFLESTLITLFSKKFKMFFQNFLPIKYIHGILANMFKNFNIRILVKVQLLKKKKRFLTFSCYWVNFSKSLKYFNIISMGFITLFQREYQLCSFWDVRQRNYIRIYWEDKRMKDFI